MLGFVLDAGHRDDSIHGPPSLRGTTAETDSSPSGFQIRKGVSASAVPFTPSSPLLPCPQEGGRHTVTFPFPLPRAQGE